MQVRNATREDGAAIRDVAEQSLKTSYSLSPGTIENAIQNWYSDDQLAAELESEVELFLVVEDDTGDVVGFSQSVLAEPDGDILWVHVHPQRRGSGIGTELFEATREALVDMGAEFLRGKVLADNEQGNTFYEDHGFERVGSEQLEIDGKSHVENIYVEETPGELQTAHTEDGREVYVDYTDADPGEQGPFFVTYSDTERDRRWGYFCGNCESLATAMDSMGRIQCSDCGNKRKPTRWDAAYL